MIWLIGVGGACGALFRYIISQYIQKQLPQSFPFGTWLINISGSFALGILAALYTKEGIPYWVWYVFGIGFCGAYTTFSTFSYEAVKLIIEKRVITGLIYIVSSVLISLFAVFISFTLYCYFIR